MFGNKSQYGSGRIQDILRLDNPSMRVPQYENPNIKHIADITDNAVQVWKKTSLNQLDNKINFQRRPVMTQRPRRTASRIAPRYYQNQPRNNGLYKTIHSRSSDPFIPNNIVPARIPQNNSQTLRMSIGNILHNRGGGCTSCGGS